MTVLPPCRCVRATRATVARCVRRPTVASVVFYGTVLVGWPMLAYAIVRIVSTPRVALAPFLIMTVACVIVLDLFPLIQSRKHYVQHKVLSTGVVYALMFVWGPWIAIAVEMIGSIALDRRAGKNWRKVLFNPAQHALTMLAAAVVVDVFRGTASLSSPMTAVRTPDLAWMALSWLVCIAVNVMLVGSVVRGLLEFVRSSPKEFRRDMSISVGVLAMSVLVVVVGTQNWVLLPLLIVPLPLLHQTGQIALLREHEAAHDALTGLPNRLALARRLDATFADHERHGTPFAVVLIDLNAFKGINDSLGHQAGDTVLASFAARLLDSVRPGDCVARLGGDEFAVILPGVDRSGVLLVAERIRVRAEHSLVIDSVTVDVRFSLGIALCPAHGVDRTKLLRHADVAMYRAKQCRTAIEIYGEQREHTVAAAAAPTMA